ncbi:MAG TPA: hypothetical protein VK943_00790 [Arenibaculum sp.]|nr:hypothetical protein [Arenibaculum sp.]
MTSLRLDDEPTIAAIGILADVLDRFSGSTSLECALVSKALRQVQATRSQVGMDFAARAFATLDPNIRLRIADEAQDAAQVFLGAHDHDHDQPLDMAAIDTRAQQRPRHATGLLNVLNHGGRGSSERRF